MICFPENEYKKDRWVYTMVYGNGQIFSVLLYVLCIMVPYEVFYSYIINNL